MSHLVGQSPDDGVRAGLERRPLSGHTAFITGAGKNLGRAAAVALAAAGANIVVHTHRSATDGADVAHEAANRGVQTYSVIGDISSPETVQAMVSDAVANLGPIDILISNAAVRPKRRFLELTPEEIQWVYSVNLFSAYYLAGATVPGMIQRSWGRIINVSGVDGVSGAPFEAHICGSKAGLIGFTKGLAVELAPYGVTVNCIAPGPFKTTRNPEWFPGWKSPDEWDREHIKLMPVGRFGDPDEFGAACVYLASPAAGFVTGHTLHMNGGYHTV